MKVLVVPDIHNKIDVVDKALNKVEFDRVVFLGDYFDDHGDSYRDIERVADWLNNKVADNRFTFLFGNHDVSYFFKNRMCSGWRMDKQSAFDNANEIDPYSGIMKFAHAEGNVLFTHAGLNHKLAEYVTKLTGPENTEKIAQIINNNCLNEIKQEDITMPFLKVGACRGGFPNDIGGVIWCDFVHEFIHTDGLTQIFGHTESLSSSFRSRGKIHDVFSNRSYCFDNGLTALFLIIISDSGTMIGLEKIETKDL